MYLIQQGDARTSASVDQLIKDYKYLPKTSIKSGIKKFVGWYKQYYKLR
tara:strand:- start:16340 stop:16486 length:147 start_codon:yes stop_codon:yes gene_type:complete